MIDVFNFIRERTGAWAKGDKERPLKPLYPFNFPLQLRSASFLRGAPLVQIISTCCTQLHGQFGGVNVLWPQGGCGAADFPEGSQLQRTCAQST